MVRDDESDLKDKHLVDYGDDITVYTYVQTHQNVHNYTSLKLL